MAVIQRLFLAFGGFMSSTFRRRDLYYLHEHLCRHSQLMFALLILFYSNNADPDIVSATTHKSFLGESLRGFLETSTFTP
jgi:hypothetical protein